MIEAIAFLQRWFLEQSDGEWEHHAGIRIESLDNPGWFLSVSLVGTEFEGRMLDVVSFRDDQPDWVRCWSKGESFEAACGPLGLVDALEQFRLFITGEIESGSDPS